MAGGAGGPRAPPGGASGCSIMNAKSARRCSSGTSSSGARRSATSFQRSLKLARSAAVPRSTSRREPRCSTQPLRWSIRTKPPPSSSRSADGSPPFSQRRTSSRNDRSWNARSLRTASPPIRSAGPAVTASRCRAAAALISSPAASAVPKVRIAEPSSRTSRSRPSRLAAAASSSSCRSARASSRPSRSGTGTSAGGTERWTTMSVGTSAKKAATKTSCQPSRWRERSPALTEERCGRDDGRDTGWEPS